MKVTKALKDWAVANLGCKDTDGDAAIKAAVFDALGSGKLTQQKFSELLVEKATTDAADAIATAVAKKIGGGSNPLFSGVRVKDASTDYNRTKRAAVHKKTGAPVSFGSKPVEQPSDYELALMGAWMQFRAAKAGLPVVLNDHTKSLVGEIVEKHPFAGEIGGVYHADIAPETTKALLDSTTSGGSYINPIIFDELITTFPLLSGEVFPFVQLIDIPRGSQVQGGSIGNPTVVWGTDEGTSQSVFDTAALVGQLNATVKPVMVLVEAGRDWMSDTPIDAGRYLVEVIGARMLSELDRVICVGNGTTEPAGIVGTSGITAVSSDMGVSGPPTASDAENLIFSVGKAYRTAERNPVFLTNDTTYRRFRGIPVGPADERRIFGMTHQEYKLFEYDAKIQNDLTNSQQIFGCLKSYKMYRRAGSEIRWIDQDSTLAAKNLSLLVVRSRWAGRVVDPNAFAMISDGQS